MHRIVGVWSLVFNLVLAGSGAWMLRAAFQPSTYQAETEVSLQIQPAVEVPLDTLARRATQAVPGFELQGMALPKSPADTVVRALGRLTSSPLYGNFSETIELSARTGRVLAAPDVRQASLGERAELVAFTLHFGQFGGWLVKVFWALGGLSPALLSLTGFLLWWRRQPAIKPTSQRPSQITPPTTNGMRPVR
ncbi:PepSY-associated TM helix domain-containing protein [Hymenobacter sp. YC55]|uniref:PepSY-associated TM helix domain-containing protein n=1 Tax=Hymenobacter sp. YC55 TaxID=3034019 RepID=UPI0023F95F03|nr:PepSY-associated TM helix domain-containing protein [Hymenobacter sp. YC55]MDF7813460.1 PepSY-associated TM helix domain-containing protein [Hymenobacter sp. YC55]